MEEKKIIVQECIRELKELWNGKPGIVCGIIALSIANINHNKNQKKMLLKVQ